MFSRTTTKRTAWTVLIAVLFVVLLPATLNAAGKTAFAPELSALTLTSICTQDGAQHATPDTPQQPVAVAHEHCMFCASSDDVFADVNTPRVVAVIESPPVVVRTPPAETLPADVAATQPLSPRAPPRLS